MTAAHLHPNLHVFDHPLIQQKLARIRQRDTPTTDFRRMLNQVAGLMLFEISDDLPTREIEIQTPLETTTARIVRVPITIVPILRAGIGMTDGLLALIPEARVGHIGLYRDETSLEPVPYYAKFPKDIAQGPVLLVDPMLATGGSAIHAARVLKEHGCEDIRFICLVAAPEGVDALASAHPDVPIHTAALDRQLNDRGYILPGLGDAGDRIFGTQ